MESHRKTRRSYNIPNHAHFLTFSTHQRKPLLTNDPVRMALIDSLARTRETLDIALCAYVIMPEHVHVVLYPREETYEIASILASIKRPVAKTAREWLQAHDPVMHSELLVTQGRRTNFRFWQAGGGYDRNITDPNEIRKISEYIHENPVRRGLVKYAAEWPWSSAGYWAGESGALLAMDPVPR